MPNTDQLQPLEEVIALQRDIIHAKDTLIGLLESEKHPVPQDISALCEYVSRIQSRLIALYEERETSAVASCQSTAGGTNVIQ